MAHPWPHPASGIYYLRERIPADVLARARGRTVTLPTAGGERRVRIAGKAQHVKLSLGTRDPREAIGRHAAALARLEAVWAALRQSEPAQLSNRQATALAGELYRAWANGEGRERVLSYYPEERALELGPAAGEFGGADFEAGIAALEASAKRGALEEVLGPLADRLLLAKGIGELEAASRELVFDAFRKALVDAMALRTRNAEGDYSPDPAASRFPEWQQPQTVERSAPSANAGVSFSSLLERWWKEGKAGGLAVSTCQSYRSTMEHFARFLGHDDAARVTRDDVLRFKQARLAQVNPRTGKTISAKTVKDGDLAALKSVLGWAAANGQITANPAEGVTLKRTKAVRSRSKGFSEDEARSILTHALNHRRGEREGAETFAAKRWVPWLCAYTGARVGEIVQLRKRDVRLEGENWIITITPEAGTVKNKERRDVPLHPHLVELGFRDFLREAPDGYLFFAATDTSGESIRGRWQGAKNRIREFAREAVNDPQVAPSHGWRHRFKTIALEAGIQERVIDAICGHAPATVGAAYGEVTVKTKADAMAKFPRVHLGQAPGRTDEG